jgi:hypothetical protein
MPPTFVMGDPHGHLDVVREHLRNAGLVDASGRWTGGDARLVWIGDFVDRGPDGLGSIDLARRLEWEAGAAGGSSLAVLGNHDLLLVAASRFPGARTAPGETFAEHHDEAGGTAHEREALGHERRAWLVQRPVLLEVGATLFVHADALGPLGWGRSTNEVNATARRVLGSGGPRSVDALLHGMAGHGAFSGPAGSAVLQRYLLRFGAARVVHGHTPLQKDGVARPTAPRVYADGRAVDVDGGIYKGGPGFLWEMTPPPAPQA